ncbi:tetratricopeptide repeat protein [Micromonospora sp. WMMD1155]|uniref:tetratricopeptide repeat protein n=1 Tax=Micromonospora sp. WMMD1155 TaxID=3016094 RepID=UPI00249B2197|nr:tetratricopeptide repeat protein [Micromonospora sp. WMMD1155]WFE54895.1 tetratricopeptide repeat protein [Micromonospora sp. WMMD1155]
MSGDLDLLTALSDRVRAFLTDRNADSVTSDAALADVHAVRCAIEDSRLDQQSTVRAQYLVAVLHWSRYLALPTGRREFDYLAAKQFFEYVAPYSPERVPPLLRSLIQPAPPIGSLTDPADVDERLAALTELGGALIVRHQRRPEPGDAELAVHACREAVALARLTGDSQTPVLVANLAAALLLQSPADLNKLDEAIAMIDAELDGADTRGTHHLLSKLAIALDHRVSLTHDDRDLVRAADVARRHADLLPTAGAPRAEARNRQAMLQGRLFDATGTPETFTAAVTAAREAVTARHPDRLRWAGHLANLANLLRTRYEHHQSRDDLDQAITVGIQALNVAPDHPKVVALRSNHSASLRERSGWPVTSPTWKRPSTWVVKGSATGFTSRAPSTSPARCSTATSMRHPPTICARRSPCSGEPSSPSTPTTRSTGRPRSTSASACLRFSSTPVTLSI